MIHKNRGNRRKQNVRKALRKARIVHNLHDYWNYSSIHSLSKNKIHCSCPMCKEKTNNKENKSKGPLDSNRSFCRLACTNNRYGRKYWKHSDRQKIDSMAAQINDYQKGDNIYGN